MIVKGIISAIYKDQKKISVILPEYDNMTTKPLPIYGSTNINDYSINEFVTVLVFNGDFSDAMILEKYCKATGGQGQTQIQAYVRDGVLVLTDT